MDTARSNAFLRSRLKKASYEIVRLRNAMQAVAAERCDCPDDCNELYDRGEEWLCPACYTTDYLEKFLSYSHPL